MIDIRHIEPADAREWTSLRLALWPEDGRPSLEAAVARFFAEPQRGAGMMPEAVLVAAEAGTGTLVGFAEVSRRAYAEGCDSSPVGFLEGWYVIAERRRQGIGRRLVAATEEWSRAMGCLEFASDALADNVVSAEAHRALGFEEVEVIRCFRKTIAEQS